jgi:hypothetical protein
MKKKVPKRNASMVKRLYGCNSRAVGVDSLFAGPGFVAIFFRILFFLDKWLQIVRKSEPGTEIILKTIFQGGLASFVFPHRVASEQVNLTRIR